MKPKLTLYLIVVLQVVIIATGFCAEARKPNIVLILADDLGYHSLGVLGQKKIKTPNLDKLAAEGIILTQFYANHLCSPSRGSLVTGMHTGHGLIRGNYELGGYEDEAEFGQMPLSPNTQTLGTELKRAGYATGIMGKWGMGGPQSPGAPNLQGFDLFYGYLDQKQAHNYYPTHLWRNEERVDLANRPFSSHPKNVKIEKPNDPESYRVFTGKTFSGDNIHEQAMRFIADNKARPFFLEMAYTLPHVALQVPERCLAQYKDKFDDIPYQAEDGYLPNRYPRATYAAMVSLLDEYVGDLRRVLKENGLDKNTVVIFTGDNGAAVNGGCDTDYFNCSGDLRGRKGSLYEGGIKVPFIACWPGVIKPGTTSGHVCAIWDLMPTFLEMAGTAPGMPVDGISFLSALKQEPQKQHDYLYWERHSANGENHTQAVRFGDWKAVKQIKTNSTMLELYDLKKDPTERRNVAPSNPDVVDKAESYFKTRRLAVVQDWNFFKPGRE